MDALGDYPGPASPIGAHTERVKSVEPPPFKRDLRIDDLIRDVRLGAKLTTARPAIEIIRATDALGHNKLFEALLNYQDVSDDQDILWQALSTIESCAELAPWLFDRRVLGRMANHPNFSVRSSAASICMSLAQYAPELVPVDMLIKLSVYDEDWYVEAPANAALKAMVRSMPAVLRIFFMRLQSADAEEREHAAHHLAEIAEHEPELLDPGELQEELSRLRSLGDKNASAYISKAVPRVQSAPRIFGYKYGI